MTLDSEDGVRVVTPMTFFPPGHLESTPLNQVVKVEPEGDEETQEKPSPKGSSVPGSASSSSEPEEPEVLQKGLQSLSSPVPPAPLVPTATADKANGPLKGSVSSTPAG